MPISESQKMFCFSPYNDAGDVIKKELKFVRDETQTKVKKLRLATDVHIGGNRKYFAVLMFV